MESLSVLLQRILVEIRELQVIYTEECIAYYMASVPEANLKKPSYYMYIHHYQLVLACMHRLYVHVCTCTHHTS